MQINAHTKIAALLKHHPAALESIVQLSSRFEKLRNPVLRKLMAGRTTIAMAAKIGGCRVQDFMQQLQPLDFTWQATEKEEATILNELPPFMQSLKPEKITDLDVRPILTAGNDPLNLILHKTKALPAGHTLKIINTFEPTPLIHLLQKKGFLTHSQKEEDGIVTTYFYKIGDATDVPDTSLHKTDWESMLQRYQNHLQTIDVTHLPMPLPMHTILEALDNLPAEKALFVYHKRLPMFLLPELAQKGFDVRIKEVSENEVHLLIFKN